MSLVDCITEGRAMNKLTRVLQSVMRPVDFLPRAIECSRCDEKKVTDRELIRRLIIYRDVKRYYWCDDCKDSIRRILDEMSEPELDAQYRPYL
ncbi:hypothetical protein [Streptomyces sp. NPDC050988]|uniref:hypothetical protein n=1 Tax=Streptomyces sp. NPDC050988 TaxID=3365637 RepID=UPI0037B11DBC